MLPGVQWHVVIYTYMGLFPTTLEGAQALSDESVRLATEAEADRLIVKTALEAFRIPTIEENVEALERASTLANSIRRMSMMDGVFIDFHDQDSETYIEAKALIEATLNLDENIDAALLKAFEQGILDIPFCLHPDNRNEARSVIAEDGRLQLAGYRPDAAARSRTTPPTRSRRTACSRASTTPLRVTTTRWTGGEAVPALSGTHQIMESR